MTAGTVAVRAPAEAWTDTQDDTEGLVDHWHVAAGDAVVAGQPVVTVMVIKTSFDVEAPTDGRLEEILVAPGDTFSRDADLAVIATGHG
jgi:pyruvate/2-oxoglutarate dehydrogenase complex dihydrolipoamide acyltransferase (E2) component